jgi:hypothetical protein
MSATVITSSRRRRSGFSTMRAKAATVPGSATSRFWAKSLITRWFSTSQATSSTLTRSTPSRSQALRALRAPAFSWPPTPPLPVSCSSMARNRASRSSISGMIDTASGWSSTSRPAAMSPIRPTARRVCSSTV